MWPWGWWPAWLILPGLTDAVPGLPFLANVALSLILFELGYRIHLRWFRHNPWVLVLGLVESVVTFVVVYGSRAGSPCPPTRGSSPRRSPSRPRPRASCAWPTNCAAPAR